MDNLKNEQTEQNSQPVATEKDLGENNGEVSLGKFKDVNALLSAYNSLQAEFTKRCQWVKELETELTSIGKTTVPKPEEEKKPVDEDTILKEKEKILKEYLLDVIGKKPKAIVMDGGISVKTPSNRPKTIAEAGNLAKEILEK